MKWVTNETTWIKGVLRTGESGTDLVIHTRLVCSKMKRVVCQAEFLSV